MGADVNAYLANRFGATELVGPARTAWLAARIRANALLLA